MKFSFTALLFLATIHLFGFSIPVINDSEFEKYVEEGIRQYQQLLEYNRKNIEEGCPENNWYIFSFNQADNWLELSNGGVDTEGNQLYVPANLQAINDELLVQFNQSVLVDVQMYICVVTDWFVPIEPFYAKTLIDNQNTSIPVKELLLDFSSNNDKIFKEKILHKFHSILGAILDNTHQDGDHSLFTDDNRVVWGLTEFRTKFFFGQEKLSGGVLRTWKADPGDMNQFLDKTELFEYINFVRAHRIYPGLNTRETSLKHNVEGFTEFLSGNLDPAYVPLADQLQFENFHYIPWDQIPDYLKSTGGGNAAYDAAKTLAVEEIIDHVELKDPINPLLETPLFRFTVNAPTTNFSSLSSKKLKQLDDKFSYLRHKTGTKFYVYFKHVSFLMPPEQYNVFANEIFIDAGLNEIEGGAVLICLPYFNPGADVLNVGGTNLTESPSIMPGIAYSAGLMGSAFFTEINDAIAQGSKIWDFIRVSFKHIPKPHRIFGATLLLGDNKNEEYASRVIVEEMTSPLQPALVTGYFQMNELLLYVDQRIEQVRSLEQSKITNCYNGADGEAADYEYCDEIAQQIDDVFNSPPSGFDALNYDFQIKEKYLDPDDELRWKGGEYLSKYAILEFRNAGKPLADWWTEFSSLEDEGVVYDIGFFELVYDALDAASLIPVIGEAVDVFTLVVGAADWIQGQDVERAVVAVTASGLGLFMIGESYIIIPLKKGNKLFIGPSIGFVTKNTIANGVNPVRVRKIFGLVESGSGSIAERLVSTTVTDGRRLHKVILDNDKLFDHIRMMPKEEKLAFLDEIADNPNLLDEVFNLALTKMKPIDYWRRINFLGEQAKQAAKNLEEADKIVFYNHIDNYGDPLFQLVAKQSEQIDAIGWWKVAKENLEGLGINATGITKAKTLLGDLNNYPGLVAGFKERPAFVGAWEVLFGQGDEALLAMRTSWDNLDIVDEYLFEYPENLSITQIDYILTGNKQEYVDGLLGPGVPGAYIKHRVRGLYEGISVEDDFNGMLTDLISINSVETSVDPIIGVKPGYFKREYVPEENLFIFKAGFLQNAPGWLDNGQVPWVSGKGIRTQMLVTLRQMKIMNIPEGTLKKAKMSRIQNAETMLYVTREILENGYNDIGLIGNDILDAPSVGYAVSTLKQASYRINNASLSENNFTTIVSAQFAKDEYKVKITQELLDQYGFDWSSLIYIDFDIHFDLQTF